MTFCRITFYLLTLLFVTSCSFRSNGGGTSGSAIDSTLAADPVSDLKVQDGPANEYGFVTEKSYQLRTCLHDRLNNQRQWGEQKIAIDGLGFHRETTTDTGACFNWTEKIGPYRQLAREHYIAVERDISMLGRKVKLRFALNPWSSAFADLTPPLEPPFETVPEQKKEDALQGTGEFASDAFASKSGTNIKVMSPFIHLKPRPFVAGGREFTLTAHFNLKVWRYLYSGKELDEEVKGPFNVMIKLNENHVQVGPVLVDSTGRISIEGMVRLPFHHNVHKPLEPEYEISAVHPEVGIVPAKGLIEMDPAAADGSFAGGNKHSIKVPETMSPPPPPSPSTVSEEDNVPFIIKNYVITRGPDIDFDSQQWVKTILLHIQVCPRENSNPPAMLREKSFRVELSDRPAFSSGAPVFATDTDGCIDWNQSFSYSVRGPEINGVGKLEVPTKYLVVQGLTDPYQNTPAQVREIQLNFWESNLVWDVKIQKGKMPEYKAKGIAELGFNQGTYIARGANFEIDRYLQLFRHFHFDLTLSPQLVRSFRYQNPPTSGIGGLEKEFQVAPNSEFEVEGVLAGRGVTPPSKMGEVSKTPLASEYLAHFTSTAKVDNYGQLQVPLMLPFLFSDVFKIKAHNKLYLRVRTKGVEKVVAVNFYVPLASRDLSKNLKVEEGEEITAAFEKLWQGTQRLSNSRPIKFKDGTAYISAPLFPKSSADPSTFVSPLELAIHLFGNGDDVIRISGDGSLGEPLWQNDVRKTIFSKTALKNSDFSALADEKVKVADDAIREKTLFPVLRVFCAKLLEARSDKLTECLKKPDVFFEMSRFVVLTEDPTFEAINVDYNLDLTFNAIFSKPFSSGRRFHVDGKKHTDVSEKIKWEGGFGVSAPIGGAGRVGNGGKIEDELYWSEEILYNDDLRTDVGLSTNKNTWSGQAVLFKLKANRQQCVMIRPVGYLRSYVRMLNFIFCERHPTAEFNETWYEFDEKTPSIEVFLANPTNLEEQGYFKLIRGEDSYLEYKLRIAHNSVAYVKEPLEGFLTGPEHPQQAEMISMSDVHRFYSDGGLGPGISERTIMRPKNLWWSEKAGHAAYNEALALCIRGNDPKKEFISSQELLVLSRKCRCINELLSQRWTQEELKDPQLKPEILALEDYCGKTND